MTDTLPNMTLPDMTAASIDDTAPEPDGAYCVTCWETLGNVTPLEYAGRGRRPKYCDEHKKSTATRSGGGSRTPRTSRDVDVACTTMAALYDGIAKGLLLVSPNAAIAWDGQIDGLNDRNRTILATNPSLAKRIASTAAKGGTASFVLSHVIAVAPVVVAVRADLAVRAARRDETPETEEARYDVGTY